MIGVFWFGLAWLWLGLAWLGVACSLCSWLGLWLREVCLFFCGVLVLI